MNNTSRLSQYLSLANDLTQIVEQMEINQFELILRPQIKVTETNDLTVRFRLTFCDPMSDRSIDLLERTQRFIRFEAEPKETLAMAAALQHQRRPQENADYVLDEQEHFLNEKVGALLDEPVADAIRTWWENFTRREAADVETLS